MKPVKPYDPSPRVQVFFPEGEGRTKQSHKDECDIYKIVDRYNKTGLLPQMMEEPLFMDAPDIDYQQAMNLMVDSQEMFMKLPSQIRNRFGNDPGAFLDFIHDPANEKELIKMGLAKEPIIENLKKSLEETPVKEGKPEVENKTKKPSQTP